MNVDILELSNVEACRRISPDIGALCAQLTELFVFLPHSPGPARVVSPDILETFFDRGGQLVVALEKDWKIVGMGRLVMEGNGAEDVPWMTDIIVDEAWRRQGIGRRIMECLVNLALNLQVRYVSVTIDHGHPAMNALLDELCFSEGEGNVRRLILNT